MSNLHKVRCKGRDAENHEVLSEPVNVDVLVAVEETGRGISSLIFCPHMNSLEDDRQWCNVSGAKKNGACPYVLDLKF